MKAKLTFNLPEDEMYFKQAINANDMAVLLFELRYNFWKQYKNTGEDEAEASWHTVKRDILQLMSDYGIDFDKLNG